MNPIYEVDQAESIVGIQKFASDNTLPEDSLHFYRNMADEKGFRDAAGERMAEAGGFTRDKADQTKQGMHSTAQTAQDKAAAGKEYTQQTSGSVVQSAQDKAAAAKDHIQQTSQSTAQSAQEKASAAKDQAGNVMNKVGESAKGALEKTKEMFGVGGNKGQGGT